MLVLFSVTSWVSLSSWLLYGLIKLSRYILRFSETDCTSERISLDFLKYYRHTRNKTSYSSRTTGFWSIFSFTRLIAFKFIHLLYNKAHIFNKALYYIQFILYSNNDVILKMITSHICFVETLNFCDFFYIFSNFYYFNIKTIFLN